MACVLSSWATSAALTEASAASICICLVSISKYSLWTSRAIWSSASSGVDVRDVDVRIRSLDSGVDLQQLRDWLRQSGSAGEAVRRALAETNGLARDGACCCIREGARGNDDSFKRGEVKCGRLVADVGIVVGLRDRFLLLRAGDLQPRELQLAVVIHGHLHGLGNCEGHGGTRLPGLSDGQTRMGTAEGSPTRRPHVMGPRCAG